MNYIEVVIVIAGDFVSNCCERVAVVIKSVGICRTLFYIVAEINAVSKNGGVGGNIFAVCNILTVGKGEHRNFICRNIPNKGLLAVSILGNGYGC